MPPRSRAARKARSAQRAHDRAVFLAERARRRREALAAAFAKLDADAALDGILARCERCGREQVAPGPCVDWFEPWEQRQGCAVCGCDVGVFVDYLPGHALGSPHG